MEKKFMFPTSEWQRLLDCKTFFEISFLKMTLKKKLKNENEKVYNLSDELRSFFP